MDERENRSTPGGEAPEKEVPEVSVPEEFKFYRQRDYLATRLNEAYVEYEKAAEAVNRISRAGLAIPPAQAQKAIMSLQLEADNLRTQCLAIVAEATIDSRDILYAVVSELRKINSRYENLSKAMENRARGSKSRREKLRKAAKGRMQGAMGARRPSDDAQDSPMAWRHPLDDNGECTAEKDCGVHEITGLWPPPICPDCGDVMEAKEWSPDGSPKTWICHFHTHETPVELEEADIERCRVCRCIETWPCIKLSNTCFWVEKNLCSACKEEAEAVCKHFVPHGFGRAPLCENNEVISGEKECEHYDDSDKSCTKARLSLKQLHPELHEKIQSELAQVDEKDGAGEKLVHGVLTVERGKLDENDGQEEKKDGELIVDQVEVALNCPVCGSRFSKITGIPGELECYCDKCDKSYWPDKVEEAGKDGES